jgi:hypothetical protein
VTPRILTEDHVPPLFDGKSGLVLEVANTYFIS